MTKIEFYSPDLFTIEDVKCVLGDGWDEVKKLNAINRCDTDSKLLTGKCGHHGIELQGKPCPECFPRPTVKLPDLFIDFDGPVVDKEGVRFFIERGGGYACLESLGGSFSGMRPMLFPDLVSRCFKLIDSCPNIDFLLPTRHPERVREVWPLIHTMKPVFPGAPGKLGRPLPCIVEGGNRPNIHLAAIANTQEEANRLVPEILKCKDLVSQVGVYADELEEMIDLGSIKVDAKYSASHYWNNGKSGLDFVYVRSGSDREPTTEERNRAYDQATSSGRQHDEVYSQILNQYRAKPVNIEWFLEMKQQAKSAGVRFGIEQLGESPYLDYYEDGPLRDWALDNGTIYQSLPKQSWTEWDHQTFGQPSPGSQIWLDLKDPNGADPSEWPENLR